MLNEEVRRRRNTSPASSRAGPAFPVDKMLEGEREKLLGKMEGSLRDRRDRPGRGRSPPSVQGRAPGTRRPAGPEPADRLLPVPRPHGRRQDRADQGAGVDSCSTTIHGDGPHRHVGIHGEAFGLAPDRRAARLCRLRRGRRPDRGRAPPALSGRALRRDREGASQTSSTCCCRCWTTAA